MRYSNTAMTDNLFLALLFGAVATTAACSSGSDSPTPGAGGSTAGVGGSANTGGAGGTANTGGSTAQSTGGAVNTGGSTGAGGSTSAGGSTGGGKRMRAISTRPVATTLRSTRRSIWRGARPVFRSRCRGPCSPPTLPAIATRSANGWRRLRRFRVPQHRSI
jgi:hypothetical protein